MFVFVCTVVDGLAAVIALLRSHGQSHVNTVVRSMMEALGDLYHLNEHDGPIYFDRLKLTSALNRKEEGTKLIQSRVGDPGAAAVVQIAKDDCKQAKAVIVELQQVRKLTPLGVTERVQAPALGPDIVGIYGQFCFDAHNDLTGLRRRHFRGNQLVIGDTLTLVTAYQAVGYAVLIATTALATVNDFASAIDLRFEAVMTAAMTTTETLMSVGNTALQEAAEGRSIDPHVRRKPAQQT